MPDTDDNHLQGVRVTETRSGPSGKIILAVRQIRTPVYGKVQIEESYEPFEPFIVMVGDTARREVSAEVTRRWRDVYVGSPDQSPREFDAWVAAMGKSHKTVES